MRYLRYPLIFLISYLLFLAWRFPYFALVAQSISSFEKATLARVEYTQKSASLWGVQLEKVKVSFPSGVKMEFGSARMRPGFGRLSAFFSQSAAGGGGQAQLNVEPDGTAVLKMDKIAMESGSQELGSIKVTGDLNYNLLKKEGTGDLRMEIPKFQAPLPVPEMLMEAGAKLNYQEKVPKAGHEVRAEVHLLSGTEFSADGQISVDPQPGLLPGRLGGTLLFKTPLKRGTLRLEGTWKKPQFSIVGGL